MVTWPRGRQKVTLQVKADNFKAAMLVFSNNQREFQTLFPPLSQILKSELRKQAEKLLGMKKM